MILYQLQCANGHRFEAWFRDSATYDSQAEQGDVGCPVCGGTDVTKAMMAPHVARGTARGEAAPQAAPEPADHRPVDDVRRIQHVINRIREHVTSNFEDVGDRFADEARAIHFGEREARDIFGEATQEEADGLVEDGVSFYRLPGQPRRTN